MTLEEIKSAMAEKGMSVRELAQHLAVNESGLGQILLGKRPLTEQLARHIAHVLETPSEAILVYKVCPPTHKVEELTAGRGCVTEKDREEALKAIIEHNLAELIEVGASLDWTPEERRALGLPPVATEEIEATEPSP